MFCFLPKLWCSYQSYFISYRDFAILIDLVLYLTEHLGKIDQSLQTSPCADEKQDGKVN